MSKTLRMLKLPDGRMRVAGYVDTRVPVHIRTHPHYAEFLVYYPRQLAAIQWPPGYRFLRADENPAYGDLCFYWIGGVWAWRKAGEVDGGFPIPYTLDRWKYLRRRGG